MRRLLLFVVGSCLAVGLAAGLAAASPASSSSSASAYLPPDVTPAGANWLSGEGDVAGSRYSPLTQINSSNVQNLHVDWNAEFNPVADQFTPETMPICCANNTMYVTYINGVAALNPATGATVWNYQGPANPTVNGLTAAGSRAYADDSRELSYNPTLNYVYAGQQDGSIVALNAKTGAPVWTVSVVGAGTYGNATGAESAPFTLYYPMAGTDGVVLSAPNGGESPFRGHLDAYDAKTGALLWRAWNTPDPTQTPYILSWSNPAEAATAGAAVWTIPAVDPGLGTVFYGTGNPYPETGRQTGNDLWTESIMAVNWKTGALRWYFQTTHHDEEDYDVSHPLMVLNVPINGKTTPVVAEGSKDGFFYVLNAKNGSQVPNFKINTQQTLDPSGQGIALNALSSTQPIPTGASFCAVIVDYSPAGLAQCGFPANTVATEYGGTNNANVQPNGTVVNAADGRPIVGTQFFEAFSPAAYFVFGGAGGGGNFGYPPGSYNPTTHDYYACVQNESGGHSDQGTGVLGNQVSVGALATQGIVGFYDAINLTNNTMGWQYESMATGNGVCYSGSLSTGGNLAFTAFKGESDLASCATITPACAAAGINTPGTAALTATNAPQGNTQQGAGGDLTPGGNFDAFDATTGKILWTWGIPFDTFAAPAISYMYQGKQYIAIYHGVAAAGTPGATSTGQRDELTVFSL